MTPPDNQLREAFCILVLAVNTLSYLFRRRGAWIASGNANLGRVHDDICIFFWFCVCGDADEILTENLLLSDLQVRGVPELSALPDCCNILPGHSDQNLENG